MPRDLNMANEHRIPIKDHDLFRDLRDFAIGMDASWEDAMRRLLTATVRDDETTRRAGERLSKEPA
jgi:hypothetical protein